jgi:DNA-binding protein HU-beta
MGFLDIAGATAVEDAPLFGLFRPVTKQRGFGGEAMTKTQLVTKLSEAGSVSKKESAAILDALADIVIKSVKKGEPVKMPELGTFRLRKMKARMGRNPQTGEALKIPARKKVGFTVAKTFKEAVLGKKTR